MTRRLLKYIAIGSVIAAGAALSAATVQRSSRSRAMDATWHRLAAIEPAGTFDETMLESLPGPARRWLLRAIPAGAPLYRSAVLEMRGTILLQPGSEPWLMHAVQVLAPPAGLIWKAEVRGGSMRISGYDRYSEGSGEMRWWLWGVVPVVKVGGADVTRSAAGRLGGEAALVPATLLPQFGTTWQAIDEDSARATTVIEGEPVSFTIHVRADGALQRVVIRRWNGDAKNGETGYIPFVVEFDGERIFDGYTLPAHMRAGWQQQDGTVAVFFDAELTDVAFNGAPRAAQ